MSSSPKAPNKSNTPPAAVDETILIPDDIPIATTRPVSLEDGRQIFVVNVTPESSVLFPQESNIKPGLYHLTVFPTLLGRGKFGEVFRAELNDECNTVFAVKRVKLNANMPEKTRMKCFNEVSLLKSLSHRHIVGCLDAFYDPFHSELIIVLEFIQGGDLKEMIRALCLKKRRFTEKRLWITLRDVSSALIYMHDKRVLHRDLKSANILIGREGRVKIADFGLGRFVLGDGSLAAMSKVGTPLYMPPEILRGERYGSKADIYSVGCILYEMIKFGTPFQYCTDRRMSMVELFDCIKTSDYKKIVSDDCKYSSLLCQVITSMLAPRPDDRPTAVESFCLASVVGDHVEKHGMVPSTEMVNAMVNDFYTNGKYLKKLDEDEYEVSINQHMYINVRNNNRVDVSMCSGVVVDPMITAPSNTPLMPQNIKFMDEARPDRFENTETDDKWSKDAYNRTVGVPVTGVQNVDNLNPASRHHQQQHQQILMQQQMMQRKVQQQYLFQQQQQQQHQMLLQQQQHRQEMQQRQEMEQAILHQQQLEMDRHDNLDDQNRSHLSPHERQVRKERYERHQRLQRKQLALQDLQSRQERDANMKEALRAERLRHQQNELNRFAVEEDDEWSRLQANQQRRSGVNGGLNNMVPISRFHTNENMYNSDDEDQADFYADPYSNQQYNNQHTQQGGYANPYANLVSPDVRNQLMHDELMREQLEKEKRQLEMEHVQRFKRIADQEGGLPNPNSPLPSLPDNVHAIDGQMRDLRITNSDGVSKGKTEISYKPLTVPNYPAPNKPQE